MNNAWRFAFFWAIIATGVLAGQHFQRGIPALIFACICAMIGTLLGPEKRHG